MENKFNDRLQKTENWARNYGSRDFSLGRSSRLSNWFVIFTNNYKGLPRPPSIWSQTLRGRIQRLKRDKKGNEIYWN